MNTPVCVAFFQREIEQVELPETSGIRLAYDDAMELTF
jgi:hypothetical protein